MMAVTELALAAITGKVRWRTQLLAWWLERQSDRLCWWIAMRMPMGVVIRVVARVWGRATVGEWGNTHPGDLGVFDALKRFESVGGRPE